MLFNSPEFFVFLAIVLGLYYTLGRRAQNRMLLVASYVFYGWWDWRFLSLLALSTCVDYACARVIAENADARRRRHALWLSLATNLGVLAFFKYFDFFSASAASLLGSLGLEPSFPVLHLVLPVGISFYTFQTLGYTVDVYRGQAAPARNFFDFALYVSFFPQLVAGPIERASRLLPQLENPRRLTRRQLTAGLQLLLLGFFKKVCIADGVAPYVDRCFENPAAFSSPELVLSGYLFAIQIYGDFSGYTDIARGVARLLGIELTLNFRQPYLSANITDFWRRWHISLSTWLRDYLYIPLGGNRGGAIHTYRNLLLTMLLGGLWHGAAWTFVVWGALHGVWLAFDRFLSGRRVSGTAAVVGSAQPTRPLAVLLTFHGVCLTWVFFRAASLGEALDYLRAALGGGFAMPPLEVLIAGVGYLVALLLIDLACWWRNDEFPIATSAPAWQRGAVYAAMLLAISFIGEANVRPFIYFQF